MKQRSALVLIRFPYYITVVRDINKSDNYVHAYAGTIALGITALAINDYCTHDVGYAIYAQYYQFWNKLWNI